MQKDQIYQPSKTLTISEDDAGQRIDNFLIRKYNKLPKSRIYRMVRGGEVRVNKKRIKVSYRLKSGDMLRVPPVFLPEEEAPLPPKASFLEELSERVLYEDPELLVLNKPSGVAVHGGSGVRLSVIAGLRHLYPKRVVELVHRLDRETSGCLIIARKRRVLRELHALMTERRVTKHYLALIKGQWTLPQTHCVDAPLRKHHLSSGERMVKVDPEGKSAQTEFTLREQFATAALVEINLLTGRTHQIRVHAASIGHPLAGDEKYGDHAFNQQMKRYGLKRLFLHASDIAFQLPTAEQSIRVVAPLDKDLEQCLNNLRRPSKPTDS